MRLRMSFISHRASSTTIRIKTKRLFLNFKKMNSHRASSTTIRIKTIVYLSIRPFPLLTEHIPLKQGLRPSTLCPCSRTCRLTEHLPLKQGLRPITLVIFITINVLSQSISVSFAAFGLHLSSPSCARLRSVCTKSPLKQGLFFLLRCENRNVILCIFAKND